MAIGHVDRQASSNSITIDLSIREAEALLLTSRIGMNHLGKPDNALSVLQETLRAACSDATRVVVRGLAEARATRTAPGQRSHAAR